jgi:GT2 family glycosyltransferase/glycosyltransferase involved in cell wall biosynthesis
VTEIGGSKREEHTLRLAERPSQTAVPGTEQPADLATRCKLAEERLASEIQLHSETKKRAEFLAARLQIIEASTTWRTTWVLRRAGQYVSPGGRLLLRRITKLFWWAVTLQLSHRYRLWREFRQTPKDLPVEASLKALGTTREDSLEALGARTAKIRIPSSMEPLVSIVIPTYGQVPLTIACLESVAKSPSRFPFEVLVVDDAYPKRDEADLLSQAQGIRLLRNPSNLGFLRSCNEAARYATGRYIYLLNNDTKVLPGAIDALVDLLETRPDVGMAGSKLLFPDGSLQEAGGILWTDASGWNYGRGDDPSKPQYNYTREVDFCSGASVLVRRDLFAALGGFDDALAPAYYEDVDLAFRIREHGLKVLYEPRSEILHFEGMSHGTDLTQGVKAHQVTNQSWIVKRWGTTLARENYPNAQHVLRARDRAKERKVILVIDHYVPEPDRDAGSRSMMGILDSLKDAGWIVKFWPHNRVYSPVYTTALEQQGIEVVDNRWPGELQAWLLENGSELDHILVGRPNIAFDVLPHVARVTNAVLSYYGVDLHFERMRRQANLSNDTELLQEAAIMERLERRIWRYFDVVFYPSEEEAATVRALSPHTQARGIVPFCFDSFPARNAPPREQSILFVAGFAHPPNVDAAIFLVREVMPLLEQEIGPVHVVLAGSNPTPAVQALAGPNVEVTGYVTDEALGRLYDQHRVAVVPLRFGAGVKGKVVEALSRGLPLVTTSIGAQGIHGLDQVVPVRDDAANIMAALKTLLTDDAAWLAQSAAQVDFAQTFFSRAAMARSVLSAFEAGAISARGDIPSSTGD